jgi:hypothetical protein
LVAKGAERDESAVLVVVRAVGAQLVSAALLVQRLARRLAADDDEVERYGR